MDETDSTPTLADGQSQLPIVGKAKFTCTRDKVNLTFDGYVCKTLQAPILCGGSFLSRNQITQELHNNKIVVAGKHHILESSQFSPPVVQSIHVNQIINQGTYSNDDPIKCPFNSKEDHSNTVVSRPPRISPYPTSDNSKKDEIKSLLNSIYIEDDVPVKL